MAKEAASPPTAEEVQSAASLLQHTMSKSWKFMNIENSIKETFWRLCLNGVAGAGGHGISMQGPCPCGWTNPHPQDHMAAQQHHFWSCDVAKAVTKAINLQSPQGSPPCKLSHLWLMKPPNGFHEAIWPAIAMAAITAMERGRRYLWALSAGGDNHEEDAAQMPITNYFPAMDGGQVDHPAPENILEKACTRAQAWFWCNLHDLTSSDIIPATWYGPHAADHPLIYIINDQLKVRLPLELAQAMMMADH